MLEHDVSKTGIGLFSPMELSSTPEMIKAILNRTAIDPGILAFLYYTSAPPNSPEHMSKEDAANILFPGQSVKRIENRANNALQNLVSFLWFGRQQTVAPLSEPKTETNPLRKFNIQARKDLGLSPKGRIPEEKKQQFEQRVKELQNG